MISNLITSTGIRSIEFINNTIMFVHLDIDRTFIVTLDKFPTIINLSPEQKKEYEIIDEHHLSFLAIDDVYSINDLLGI